MGEGGIQGKALGEGDPHKGLRSFRNSSKKTPPMCLVYQGVWQKGEKRGTPCEGFSSCWRLTPQNEVFNEKNCLKKKFGGGAVVFGPVKSPRREEAPPFPGVFGGEGRNLGTSDLVRRIGNY